MNLSKVITEKILERGWITPDEVKNAYAPLIQDFDIKLTRGAELRKDLIMTRLDNFLMEIIRRCEQNLEREIKRERQSNLFGRTTGQTGGEQADGKWRANDQVPDSRQGLGEGKPGMVSDFVLPENSGDSTGSDDWRQGSNLGKTRPFPNKG